MNKIQFLMRGFFKKFSELPENLLDDHYRYFVVYSYVFFAALLFHFFFIFIFLLISVKSLAFLFGAPQEMPDRAQHAIACAIEMQNRMAEVNDRNRSQGLPDLEMGIGLNETEVIVGNIGSVKRSKYGAVGSGVNMTNRIESYTVGGQILISESVRQKVGAVLRIDAQRVTVREKK